MAKFIDEKNLTERYIENYIQQVSDYSKYIEGSPTFCTYYSKDILASSESITLGGTIEIIGVSSPIRYHKILNFPIFNIEEIGIDIETDNEDIGINTNGETSALILPNTIKPLPDDYLVLEYVDKKILYRINNVEIGNINKKVIYKISMHLDDADINILEEKQVTATYNVIYENVGKEVKSIILLEDYVLVQKADLILDKLKNAYYSAYYITEYNSFIYNNTLYDNYLHYFIDENELFIETKSFLKNIKPNKLDHSRYFNIYLYEMTLFYAIENITTEKLCDRLMYINTIFSRNDPTIIFNLYNNKYTIYNMDYFLDKSERFPYSNYFNELKNKININEQCNINISEVTIINFIIDFLRNNISYEHFIKVMESFKFSSSFFSYYMIPCILVILKKIRERLLVNH